MTLPTKFLLWLAAASLLLSGHYAQAQADDDGQATPGSGLVRLAAAPDSTALNDPVSVSEYSPADFWPGNLYPYACGNETCRALQMLLFPRLFDTDAETGALLTAGESDRALALSLPARALTDTVILPLRQDMTWSDGEPITAYDALYSLLADGRTVFAPYGELVGAGIVDEFTLALRFALTPDEQADAAPADIIPSATCDDLPRTNVFIIPAHTLSPDFRTDYARFAPQGETPALMTWLEAMNVSGQQIRLLSSGEPLVTAGRYRVAAIDTEAGIRLVPAHAPLSESGGMAEGAVLESAWLRGSVSPHPAHVAAFLSGARNLLLDVPLSERANLRALSDANARNLQIEEPAGRQALVLVLNFANGSRPLPGLHPVTGEPLDQETHRLFSDLAVRQALQLAIDQDALIEGVLQRSAQRLSGLLPPTSWAYDPSLPALEFDLAQARQLLEAAGWQDSNGDGIRECVSCQNAPLGTELYFGVSHPAEDSAGIPYRALITQLAQRWQLIGARVFDGETYGNGQLFDAYLTPIGDTALADADPDRTLMLTAEGDMLNDEAPGWSSNQGSYSNPEITRLLQDARTVPACDPAARAAIYAQIERLLQADLPFLFVAAPNEFYAAAPGILGFAPRAGDALWNMQSWRVSP